MPTPPIESASTASGGRTRVRRAVTEGAKRERREAILNAAEAHLRDAGFERFSMEVLARELEVARGTLYRYFGTREELLLGLYRRQQHRFITELASSLTPEMDDAAFVHAWWKQAVSDPLLLELRARLESVIEHNVPRSELIDAKRAMKTDMDTLTAGVCRCLNLAADQAEGLIVALIALILGAAQADAAPHLDTAALPEDISRMLSWFSGKRIFRDNALLILTGLRATP